jgi:hypothetical protein
MVAMGDMVGVYTEDELKGLSPQDRNLLKQKVLQQLQTSPAIWAIINKDPGILTRDPHIKPILQRGARPLLNRLKK